MGQKWMPPIHNFENTEQPKENIKNAINMEPTKEVEEDIIKALEEELRRHREI